MRISFRIGLAILLVSMTGAVTSGASSYEEATTAMRSGDFARAAELLQLTIESSPPWAAGHVALAQCRFMLDQPDQAEASLARALEIDPDTSVFDVYGFAGMKLYSERRYGEAIRPLEQALRSAPRDKAAPISRRLANAQFQIGRYAAASEALQEHMDQFGFEPGTAYFLAVAQHHIGETVASIETMEEAVLGGLEGQAGDRAVERLARWSTELARNEGPPEEYEERLATALSHTRTWRDRNPGNEQAFALWFDVARSAGSLPEYDDALARMGTIEPEYDASQRVVVALDQLDKARMSLGAAVEKEPALEARATELGKRLDVTEQALQTALEGLLKEEGDLDRLRDLQVLKRCRVVHWNLRTERAAVTEADREFYAANECRERL